MIHIFSIILDIWVHISKCKKFEIDQGIKGDTEAF